MRRGLPVFRGRRVFLQDDRIGRPVDVGNRCPTELARASSALPERRVDEPEFPRSPRENSGRLRCGRNSVAASDVRLLRLAENRVVEKLVIQSEFLQSIQRDGIMVPGGAASLCEFPIPSP